MTSKVVSLKQQQPAECRGVPSVDIEHVLAVSAGQFADQGFDGVSMREISRECGCPAGSIYYHFSSKSDLYKEAYANKIEHSIDQVTSRLQPIKDPKLRFEALIEAFHELFTDDRTLLLLIQRDVIEAAANGRHFLSRGQFNYFNLLIRRVASEALSRPVGAETAFAIGSLIFGLCGLSMVVHEVSERDGEETLRAERAGLVRAAKAILGY